MAWRGVAWRGVAMITITDRASMIIGNVLPGTARPIHTQATSRAGSARRRAMVGPIMVTIVGETAIAEP